MVQCGRSYIQSLLYKCNDISQMLAGLQQDSCAPYIIALLIKNSSDESKYFYFNEHIGIGLCSYVALNDMKCQNIIVNDLYRPGRKVLLCEDCQISKKSYIMRETRKRKRESDPTSPSSRARFNYLSPTSKISDTRKL